MIEKVTNIRKQVKEGNCSIPTKPGIYTFWFDKQGMSTILKPLDNVDLQKIQIKVIGNKNYYALYFGIANNLKERATWHICQKHTKSSVKSGYLSTFRQSLSALLKLDMTAAEIDVNAFIDKHCFLECETDKNKQTAEKREKNELLKNYYPLNIQNNKCVNCKTPNLITQLKSLRKYYRK